MDEESNLNNLAGGAGRRRRKQCVHEEHHVEKHRFLEAWRKRKKMKRSHYYRIRLRTLQVVPSERLLVVCERQS